MKPCFQSDTFKSKHIVLDSSDEEDFKPRAVIETMLFIKRDSFRKSLKKFNNLLKKPKVKKHLQRRRRPKSQPILLKSLHPSSLRLLTEQLNQRSSISMLSKPDGTAWRLQNSEKRKSQKAGNQLDKCHRFCLGAENCLGGLKFVVTGVLESLEREMVIFIIKIVSDIHKAEELIKDHGGAIQKSVSKRVDYVVAGEEPGHSV